MQCKAKSKQSGERCKRSASPGFDVCAIHGGKTPRGINAPAFKHGRYSKYLPANLLNAYQDALADDSLNDTRDSKALLDAMIANLLPGLDTADSGKVWAQMKTLVGDCRTAYKSDSFANLESALDKMDDLANRRLKHYATYDQVQSLLDDRRKTIETENKLELAGQRAVSIEQFMLLISNVLNIIQTVVTDRQQRYAIAEQIQHLISLPESVDSA